MNIYAIAPLLGAFVYACLIVLSLRHPRRAERRAFALYLTSAGIWSLISSLLHLDYPFFRDNALVGTRLLILAILWMVLTYYHFVRVFAQRRPGPGVYGGVAFVLLVALLFGLGLAPHGATASGGVIDVDHGPFFFLYLGGLVFLGGAAAHSLIRHYQEVATPIARSRVSYLLVGLSVVSVALLTNVYESLARYPIDQLGNLLNALIISYAILKYQLLDIKFVLRRGIAYSLLSISLTAGYLLVLYLVQQFAQFSLQASMVPAAFLALLMALLFIPLRSIAQERVDRLFYRHTYAYRKLLMDFSHQAANILDLEELSRKTVHLIVNALRAQWGALLFPDAISADLRAEYIEHLQDQQEPREVRLRQDNPLVAHMVRQGQVVRGERMDAIPQEKGLWDTEREELQALGVSLLCPVQTRGVLTGVIVLGPKEGGAQYTDEETDLVLSMASGAAMAMENARIMGSLRRREEAHEQLLARVVSAQEEERQRIAADLHDGVAQWLVRASYQTQVGSALAANSSNGLQQELSEIEATLDASVKELRRVLAGLRPPALDELGLPHALRRELESLQPDGFIAHMEVQGVQERLSPPVEISAYRIVQEALNNVRRHSGSTVVDMQLHFDEDSLCIQVSDNGVGFNVAKTVKNAASSGHMGLLGMRQRAESLGGELRIESREGAGTRVILRLPLDAKS